MEVQEIPIAQIDVSRLNTRKDLQAGTEDSSLLDLAASIRENGLLSPVTVRPTADGRFELLAGQRRFLACGSLGWNSIPAIVSTVEDDKALQISLIENVHRADLHPMDKAQAFQQLAEYYEGDLNRVSKETGMGVSTIRKYLAIIKLPESIKQELSTREGPAKIETLYQLQRTFEEPADIQRTYKQIEGFSQNVQVEIIKESEGDTERVPELVARAQEGAFNTKFCRGLAGELMCEFIPLELADDVIEVVNTYRSQHATEPSGTSTEMPKWKRRLMEITGKTDDQPPGGRDS